MATAAAASGSGTVGADDVEGMMARLGLREEDLDDVVFEEEGNQSDEATRWLAVGKVHTDTEFSHFWFFKNMRKAWDLAKDVKIKVFEDNLFMFQFACLGNWEKVMDGGPWVFRGKSVLMAPYDGFTKPSSIDLNTLLIWIQIHDLPVGYKDLIKTLAGKVGQFVSAETPSDDYTGNYYRARVRIDVRKQLKAVVSIIRNSQRQLFLVKYERLPDWCAVCGMLGHLYKEHGDGVHSLEKLVFKDLRVGYGFRSAGFVGRGRGRGSGRGGRGGRGEDPFANDDAAGNFLGSVSMEEDATDPNRKRAALSIPVDGTNQGTVGDIRNRFELTGHHTLTIPLSPPIKRDPKRSKKGANEEEDVDGSNATNSGSAGSQGGTAGNNESVQLKLSGSRQCPDSA
ncbi:hypothetical protein ACQ4PT_000661 [Festuca glaucescens]